MSLHVYNTLSGKKEIFTPRRPGQVGMYVCGITAYDHCHLGHARAAVVFDAIRRYLEYAGYEVTYVRNFTDIDDKIIQRAQKENRPCSAVARQFIQAYQEDMKKLGVEPATIEPKATEHIADIVNLVQGLIDKGYAYKLNGDVYFSVRKFPAYGKLSGRNLEELQAGARVEVDERKQDPLDFALWKASKPGEPAWESPWGMGRPGWHIECSAMSMHYLGASFDLHGGGRDLIFPHHENEIAQSESFSGQPFVNYWLHNGFVNINQEKMSKSLGNFFTIKEILAKYPPAAVRFFLLSTHYRSPIEFSDQNLEEAKRALERFGNTFRTVDNLPDSDVVDQDLTAAIAGCHEQFIASMDDDFNSAAAIGTLFELLKLVNQSANQPNPPAKVLNAAVSKIQELGAVLHLFAAEEAKGRQEKLDGLMTLLLELRQNARLNKDWATSDKIRKSLLDLGIQLEDTPQGTTWHIK
ncbi:MAG: cysteine--tRNA ligase [Candidatus Schekmanbacteria bacterium]|nr:cysteine--tRNA ligase [Candidatus Schekmanbacteria bacterium]